MKARVIDYGIKLSSTNNPMVTIRFACEDGQKRSWNGSLNEGKAREITLDALIRCGFTGSDVSELTGGAESGLLDHSKELDLTIDAEEYNGKTFEKIKWINEVGGKGFKDAMKKEDAVKVFNGMNLKADLAARRAMQPKRVVNSANSDDDVSF